MLRSSSEKRFISSVPELSLEDLQLQVWRGKDNEALEEGHEKHETGAAGNKRTGVREEALERMIK